MSFELNFSILKFCDLNFFWLHNRKHRQIMLRDIKAMGVEQLLHRLLQPLIALNLDHLPKTTIFTEICGLQTYKKRNKFQLKI